MYYRTSLFLAFVIDFGFLATGVIHTELTLYLQFALSYCKAALLCESIY